ncbi:MAG: 50S ribosomal protein L5 [Candidatus Levybacteria bacterium]|nr:50S ribosomal protein L5 [Candidatus Levybacteria bacterium]
MTKTVSDYKKEYIENLQKKLNIKNPMAVPILTKIVVNMGVKDAVSDKKNMERATKVMVQITGQKPKVTRAKKAIAAFKLRERDEIGLVVTLRGKRMYGFFNKLVNIVLPRLRDFRGVRRGSFDGRGNYALGFTEYAFFPEIDPATVERAQGMEIIIVTTAKDNNEGVMLLETLGMPFEKTQMNTDTKSQ